MVLLDILYLHVDLVCSCSSLALSFLYWPFYLESMYLIRFHFIWFDYLSIFQHIECLVCVVVNYVYCVHNVTSFLHFFAFTYHLSVYLVHLFLHCVVSKCFLLTLVGLTLMWPVVSGAGGFWSPGTNVHVSVSSCTSPEFWLRPWLSIVIYEYCLRSCSMKHRVIIARNSTVLYALFYFLCHISHVIFITLVWLFQWVHPSICMPPFKTLANHRNYYSKIQSEVSPPTKCCLGQMPPCPFHPVAIVCDYTECLFYDNVHLQTNRLESTHRVQT